MRRAWSSTIGLGLGFVCSAFTVINGYLLKPFDVRDPHALYELTWDSTAARRHAFNIDELEAIQASNEVFSDVLGFAAFQLSLDDGTAYTLAATGNYFDALGVQPFLGRLLRPDDAARPGARAVVVLSHDAWLARFGADPSIVGRHVRLGRHVASRWSGSPSRGFSDLETRRSVSGCPSRWRASSRWSIRMARRARAC